MVPPMSVDAGLAARIERQVTDLDTAIALGSGDVGVLATPRVLAWAEAACVEAVGDHLDADQTTVGTRMQIDHVQPSPVGATITIAARLELVEGRRLTFAVTADDGHGTVASGRVVRVLVDRARFLERATG